MWVCTAAGRLAMSVNNCPCFLKEPAKPDVPQAAKPDVLQAAGTQHCACGIGPISSDRHISWGQLDSAPQTCLPGVHVSVLAISQTVAVHEVAVLQPLTLSVQKQKAAFRMNEHSSAY